MLDSLISKTSKVLKSIKADLDDLEEHLFKTTIFCSSKIRVCIFKSIKRSGATLLEALT